MTGISRVRKLWRNLRHGDEIERDLSDEVRAYLELLTDEKIAAGLQPERARRAALVELGGVEAVREATRASHAGALLEEMWRDLRYAARVLRRSPGFTAVAVLTLALGIGANAAIFSVVHAVLLRPLPFPEPERLVFGWVQDRDGRRPFSGPDFTEFRDAATAFEEIGAVFSPVMVGLSSGGRTEPVRTREASHNFLAVYGLRPFLGRTFRPEEDRPGMPGDHGAEALRVAMISHGYWRSRFGGEPTVIGRLVRLDLTPYEIVGVTPPGFQPLLPDDDDFGAEAQVWTLSELDLARMPRDASFVRMVARLKRGVTLDAARDEAAAFARRQRARHSLHREKGFEAELVPLDRALTRAHSGPILILLGAVGLLLLIACANLATLLLARLSARERELAVRLSLGAGRGRIVRQVLTECLILSLAGAGLGLALAGALLRVLPALAPASLPRVADVGLDGPVLTFALGAAVVTTLLVGLLPALRFSQPWVAATLREAGRGHSRKSSRFDGLLVAGEVALSLVLVIGSALLLRSFAALLHVAPGFRPHGVLTADLTLTRRYPRYPSAEKRVRFVHELADRLSRLPGVEDVGLALVAPLSRQDTGHSYATAAMASRGVLPPAKYRPVTPGYFGAAGTRIVAGRDFTWAEVEAGARVSIVDEHLASLAWPGESAIGERLRLETWAVLDGQVTLQPFWSEVIGVAENARSARLEHGDIETVYLPYHLYAVAELSVLVRSSGDPASLAGPVRAEIARIDPDLAVFHVRRLEDLVSDALAPQRFSLVLLGAFAAAGLLLAWLGLYGVLAFAVGRRRREIGIRMAVGASAARVRWVVLARGLALVGAGLALGLAGALAVTRFLASQLYGVGPTDARTFSGATLATVLVSLLACDLPARRAARVDPGIVLKGDG
jgi:putative ABC transport system permease protein